MTAACAIAVVLTTYASAAPAPAQPQSHTRWAVPDIAAEAKRLTVQPDADWSRVVRLKPATAIVVELDGLTPASRHFLWADDSELGVLKLLDARLSRGVKRTLLEIAAMKPRFIDGLSRVVHGHVRVTPDGVFLRDRKLVELADISERIPRPDVVTVATAPVARGSIAGAVVGGAIGLVIVFTGHFAEGFGYSRNPIWLVGLLGVPLTSAALGYQAGVTTTQTIIYRAPHSR